MTGLVGIYVLPSAIGLLPGCFGKRYLTRLWGRRVIMSLPVLEWNEALDKPTVVAPSVDGLPTSPGSGFAVPRLSPDGFEWGTVDTWWANSRKLPGARVNAVALEFSLADGDVEYYEATNGIGGPTGAVVQGLFQEIDPGSRVYLNG